MHLSRRQLLAATVGLPVIASVLNACGGGGGSSSGGGGSGGGGTSSSSSSTSSSSSAGLTFSSGSKFGTWSNVRNATFYASDFRKPAILSNGNIAVAWQTDNSEIKVQIFSSAGAKIGSEILVNTASPTFFGSLPDIVALSSGGFVVVWGDQNQLPTAGRHIYAQVFDDNGAKIGTPFACDTADPGSSIRVVATSDNRFVVSWITGDVKLQILQPNGQKAGPQQSFTPVLEHDTGVAVPSPAYLSNGRVAVLVHSEQKRLSIRIYSDTLSPIGSEILVNIFPEAVYLANIAPLKDGKFVVTFSQKGDDLSLSSVYGQIYNNNGEKIGERFRVNTTLQDSQYYSHAALLTSGDFIVTWFDSSLIQATPNDSVRGQVFTANGEKKGGEFTIDQVSKLTGNNTVTALPNGGFIANWVEFSGPASDPATVGTEQMRIFTPI